MRRRHPWWALLATTALVLASLLAPMEGAAYRIPEATGEPVERGDPDVPNDGPAQKPNEIASHSPAYQTILVLQPAPGMVLRIPLRIIPLSSVFRFRVHSR
jgi:hypothetical protein